MKPEKGCKREKRMPEDTIRAIGKTYNRVEFLCIFQDVDLVLS